jgi:hypothetical protein
VVPCHHGMARPQTEDRGTASDMEGSCGQPTRDGLPAWGLGEVLTTPLRKNRLVTKHSNVRDASSGDKTIRIKIYRTIILPVVLYGCETWSLTFWEERRLRMFEESIWA